jgi:hypothetical protein
MASHHSICIAGVRPASQAQEAYIRILVSWDNSPNKGFIIFVQQQYRLAPTQPKMIPKLPFDAHATRSLLVLRLLVGELLPCPNDFVSNLLRAFGRK